MTTTMFDTSLAGTRPASWLAGRRAALADWLLYRQTLGELRALSDSMLADLDLNRADLARVAREAVYGG